MTAEDACPELWFAPQRPATERTFVGRVDVVGPLENALRAGWSCGLLGEGGMGKTSTLRAVERRLGAAGFRCSYVSVARGQTAQDVASHIAEGVIAACQIGGTEQRRALIYLGKGKIPQGLEALANAAAEQDPSGRRPVVLLDDCHRMDAAERGTLWSALHGTVDKQHLALLIAGKPPLWDEAHAQTSMFANLLQPKIPLRDFTLDEIGALCARARTEGLEVSEDVAAVLAEELVGYPFGLCRVLYQIALERKPVTPETVRAIARRPEIRSDIHARRGDPRAVPSATTVLFTPTPPKRVYLLHAPADSAHADELRAHLAAMQSAGKVSLALPVSPGAEAAAAAELQIDASDAVLVLTSVSFVASADCQSRLAHALARSKSNGRPRVVPVHVGPVHLANTPLAGLESLPRGGQPIALTEPKARRDAVWVEVLRDLGDLL